MLVPDLCANLLSVSQLTAKGLRVDFNGKGCLISGPDGEEVTEATVVNGMYKIDLAQSHVAYMAHKGVSQLMWHRRLGHIGADNLKRLSGYALVNGVEFENGVLEKCGVCVIGKQSR